MRECMLPGRLRLTSQSCQPGPPLSSEPDPASTAPVLPVLQVSCLKPDQWMDEIGPGNNDGCLSRIKVGGQGRAPQCCDQEGAAGAAWPGAHIAGLSNLLKPVTC